MTPCLIGMTSATGGFQALEEILGNLPREFPFPIVLYPSIHPNFVEELAARLDAKTALRVVHAEDGQVPAPGCVHVAGCDVCLLIKGGCIQLLERGQAEYPLRRAKDALFRSMALDQGPGAVAVILSGMGVDGAEGMKAVRDAGGYTIVQDKATSVIYGPADAAVRLGAASESLPVQEIAPRLVALVNGLPALN
jgi:two-component system chemotaxis response regulator CheB